MLLMWLYVTGWVISLGAEVDDLVERRRGIAHTQRVGGEGAR